MQITEVQNKDLNGLGLSAKNNNVHCIALQVQYTYEHYKQMLPLNNLPLNVGRIICKVPLLIFEDLSSHCILPES